MNFTAKGIVIKEVTLKETDKIVHILTDDVGVISAFARNSKNIKNRLVSSTSLLSYCEFEFFKKGQSYTINKADILKTFLSVREDLEKCSLSIYLCQICDFLAPKEENAAVFLRLILNSLFMIERDSLNINQIKFIFELKFMCLTGYEISMKSCNKCQSENFEKGYFNLYNGEFICCNCYNFDIHNYYIFFTREMIKAFQHIIYSEFKNLFFFKLSDKFARYLSGISEKFLLYHNDRKFSSLDFYNSIKDLS